MNLRNYNQTYWQQIKADPVWHEKYKAAQRIKDAKRRAKKKLEQINHSQAA